MALGVCIQMQPEFQDKGAVIDQPTLEAADPGQPVPEAHVVVAAVHARQQRRRIPARAHQTDASAWRQIAPVARHRRAAIRLVLGVGEDVQMTRFHPVAEVIDDLVFATTVDAGEHQQHRECPARGE